MTVFAGSVRSALGPPQRRAVHAGRHMSERPISEGKVLTAFVCTVQA